jgi:hypothetical protein
MRFLLYILLASFYAINPIQVNAGMLPTHQGSIVSKEAIEKSSFEKDKLSQKQFASLTAIPQTGINYSSYRYHPFEKYFLQEVNFGNSIAGSLDLEFSGSCRFNKPIGLVLLFPHHFFW